LFIAICPSCGDQAGPRPALCIDHGKNPLSDATQNNPPFLSVVAGNVRVLKFAFILKDLAGNRKRNPVLAQVGLSFLGIPLEVHDLSQLYYKKNFK
jgi:hypothetical protein